MVYLFDYDINIKYKYSRYHIKRNWPDEPMHCSSNNGVMLKIYKKRYITVYMTKRLGWIIKARYRERG